jgi:hypothetical protein
MIVVKKSSVLDLSSEPVKQARIVKTVILKSDKVDLDQASSSADDHSVSTKNMVRGENHKRGSVFTACSIQGE